MAARPLSITLANGESITVQPTLEDRLKFESTLRKNPSWGPLKDNAMKLDPFLAWSAGSRSGQITQTWAEFTTGPAAALDVSNVEVDDDPEGDELEVPGLGKDTPTAASITSPSSLVSSSVAPLGSGVENLPRH